MKRALSIWLCLVFVFCVNTGVVAYDTNDVTHKTSAYLLNVVAEPDISSIGGEWAIIGLSRSGESVPDKYFEDYFKRVEQLAKEKDGIFHSKKYTEYSRVILALTAIGKNPSNVAGYNLLTYLSDYEKTVWQGINGPIWALIALDCKNYDIPFNPDAKIRATRQMYVEYILSEQNADGGWSLSGEISEADITGMALQALSNYSDDKRVGEAIDKALLCMSKVQNNDGGFSSYGVENSESTVQMLMALCELKISINDQRFVKDGNTLLDGIMSYYNNDGSFKHTKSQIGADLMATEQCFYSLVALNRFSKGQNSLYDMTDVVGADGEFTVQTLVGLEGKHPDVKKKDVVSYGKTFSDIAGHGSKYKIEALSERGIINGKTNELFDPESNMTRAEFATIVVKALGLPIKENQVFTDVNPSDWFYDYVNTAFCYGIVNGVSETEFNPYGIITREEASVMVSRAAKLCGMDTEMDTFNIRNVLAAFTDYVKASDWAMSSLAFCYDSGILPDDAMEIHPKNTVSRAQIADMLYNLLSLSDLL